MNSNQKDSFQSLINKGNLLLEESVRVHYPLATIRVKYLLAVLYFLEDKIEMSKKYLNSSYMLDDKIVVEVISGKSIVNIYKGPSLKINNKQYG